MEWTVFGSEALRMLAAVALCALIGVERQVHQKDAGLRTHSLVGMGAALFTIAGLHHWDAAAPANWDPMRVAAQIVTGIGFLGAGVIFVNRDSVRGLTTAAAVWLSAAIGMACGGRMIPLAALATLMYMILMLVVSPLVSRVTSRDRRKLVRLTYADRSGTLRRILTASTQMEFKSAVLSTRQVEGSDPPRVEVVIRFTGGPPLSDLVAELSEVEGVHSAELFEDADFQKD